MSPAARNDGSLIVGGVPRAELLPPELEIVKRLRAQRRSIVTLGVLVVIAVIAGYALATFFDTLSKVQLDAAEATSAGLIEEQAKYVEVQQLEQQVSAAKKARAIGTATEIDWRLLVEEVQATAVGDLRVTSIVVQAGTPITPFEDTTVPLEHPRVAEVKLISRAGKASSAAIWLAKLGQLPGFADARIDSIVAEGGGYNINATVHLNDVIFTHRFDLATGAGQ
jgi:hypothetical protein